MNNVRLVCGNQIVDLPTDFGILINKSIADIREPESRSSDWSKTFTLPGTKRNNKLFSHLFDLNLSIRNTTATNFNPDFNPNLKASASLYVDEVTQIEGFIRLLNINVTDRHEIQYECTLHGQLADLFAKIADKRMSELDFSEYNHTINSTNIFNSWDTSIVKNGSSGYVNFSGGKPIGEGYVYGWIDNGTYANYDNLYTDNMTPYVYAKQVVDKIFSGAGYTYSSGSFFNTDLFKRLVVPCPTKNPILSEAQVTLRQFEASPSSSATYNINTSPPRINFGNELTDPSNQYNTTNSRFTNAFQNQVYDFYVDLKGTAQGLNANSEDYLFLMFNVNGRRFRRSILLKSNGLGEATLDQVIKLENFRLFLNDYVEVEFDRIMSGSGGISPGATLTGASITLNSTTSFYNVIVEGNYGYGDQMDFTGFFTGTETKQREFMRWVFTMFNLYCEPDPAKAYSVVVLPREDFYTSTVRDWTMKRDLLQPMEIIPMGDLDAGRYVFTYAEGDDEQNKYYREDYGRTYGDRNVIVENDFVKDEKRIEIGFAPTQIIKPEIETDKYLPSIETNSQEQKGGKLRILQYDAIACNVYRVINGSPAASGTPTINVKQIYPFMSHLDDPNSSTVDINFGMPRMIGLKPGTAVTNNNLYNKYWSKYIQEITDKDSKIVRGHFHLTPADMEKLSFRDLYFFDGNYFRLNKVEDYDPINPSVNICEFLFLKTGQTFTATTGSVGGGGEQGTGEETEYNPGGGRTNGKVIEQKGVSIGEYNSVGDGIGVGNAITNLGLRNAAFATSGVTFLCDDSIVIGEAPAEPVGCNEVWIQGQQITPNNFGTNRFAFPAGNYTLALHDDIIISLGTGNHTLTLPEASTAEGKLYWVVKKGAQGTLTIDAYADELIDGAANYTINNHYGTACLVCDGTEWYALTNK
jgi:hypothetical protein